MIYQRLIFLLLVFIFISCRKTNNTENNIVSVKDDLGDNIILEKFPSRIISLAPSITETLYSIGADSLLIGVTDFCDYPAAVRVKTRVGGMINPNFEIIMSLNPELILVTTEGNSKNTYQSLKNLGYKIFASNPRNYEDVINMIKNLGILTNQNKNADSVINEMNIKKSNILSKTNVLKRDTCFILISLTPLMTASKNTFINEIVNYSGFYNLYSDESVPYPEINLEDFILKKPDFIIVPTNYNDSITSDKLISNIQNILKLNNSSKRILLVDENLFFRPGPRMMDAAEQLLNERLNHY